VQQTEEGLAKVSWLRNKKKQGQKGEAAEETRHYWVAFSEKSE